MLSGLPETTSSPVVRSPDPSASLHRASVPAPNHLGGSPLNSLQLVSAFPVLESARLEVVFQIRSQECQVKGDNPFSSFNLLLGLTAQDTSCSLQPGHTTDLCSGSCPPKLIDPFPELLLRQYCCKEFFLCRCRALHLSPKFH